MEGDTRGYESPSGFVRLGGALLVPSRLLLALPDDGACRDAAHASAPEIVRQAIELLQ